MNKHLLRIALLAALLPWLSGCSRSAAPAIDTGKAAEDTTKAFAAADAETKAAAADAAQALQKKDYAASMVRLSELRDTRGLTPEQQIAVAQSMNALVRDLRVAEQKGDLIASNLLEHYRKTK